MRLLPRGDELLRRIEFFRHLLGGLRVVPEIGLLGAGGQLFDRLGSCFDVKDAPGGRRVELVRYRTVRPIVYSLSLLSHITKSLSTLQTLPFSYLQTPPRCDDHIQPNGLNHEHTNEATLLAR